MSSGDVDWEQLIRRSFGVPDVIGDDAASRALEGSLNALNAMSKGQQPDDPSMETRILEALAWAGRKGSLDDYLVGLPEGERLAKDAVHTRIHSETNWSTVEIYGAIEVLTGSAIVQIREFVSRHPFVDPDGRYFGSLP